MGMIQRNVRTKHAPQIIRGQPCSDVFEYGINSLTFQSIQSCAVHYGHWFVMVICSIKQPMVETQDGRGRNNIAADDWKCPKE
ncbi:hypothetical protein A0H81_06894 [Grifola frondosa]|uniref:Uncharacterized protein n=1 Tax=Grifola frondosa TaxID=5627 RepID=A0A1C7M8M6_GRIFR|nr:hypothetical protein A0H81_06894 [Grifola frondosa]